MEQRFAEVEKVVKAAERAAGPEGKEKVGAAVRRVMERAPEFPDLVSRKTAAEILEVNAPYIVRFEEQGRLKNPVPVEGTVSCFLRSDVMDLRDEVVAMREARAKRQAEKAAEKAAA